jgi:ABC-type nitrate/sulfonate/bicarbonate transport system permease component
MTAPEPKKATEPGNAPRPGSRGLVRGFFGGFLKIRDEPTVAGKLLMSSLCLAIVLCAWYLATRGEAEERAISPQVLGSPAEVFGSFGSLWFDRALMRNLLASLWRVIQGFVLAAGVGVPLGIVAGTFRRIDAFLAPVSIFGRNIPIVTLVPITLLWFGTGEGQKIAFIFIACVAFILFDASRSVAAVGSDYLDTAYTLGASRRQVLTKVLVPLSMPEIFNSMRLLFGLAFGYIILAEMIDMNSGIGKLILNSQRRGPREHVYLILLFITLTAYLLDRLLFFVQRRLFAYRYAGR